MPDVARGTYELVNRGYKPITVLEITGEVSVVQPSDDANATAVREDSVALADSANTIADTVLPPTDSVTASDTVTFEKVPLRLEPQAAATVRYEA